MEKIKTGSGLKLHQLFT